PSYALNLAQLGVLCISNLCATKPFGTKNLDERFTKFLPLGLLMVIKLVRFSLNCKAILSKSRVLPCPFSPIKILICDELSVISLKFINFKIFKI
ncbi:hypothetical protein N5I05_08150, partial [Acinetobacter johnsonii]|uniref:hypothetical protein n=1 Tax=Acinetobacter johnsonii TaxID=40214 RepID=UPI002447EDF5